MNLYDLKKSPATVVTVADISDILKVDPQSLRKQAREDPKKLGFPIIQVGKHIKVPRIPFLHYLGEDNINETL